MIKKLNNIPHDFVSTKKKTSNLFVKNIYGTILKSFHNLVDVEKVNIK